MDYNKTINLPKTEFPMRAGLPKREPDMLKRWKEQNLYTELLKKYPIDLIFLGIGENGHLAFNDPAVADFGDPKMVKIVELDDVCRQQQVNDGCFPTLNDVPKQAMSLTMSFIMSVPNAICVVPTDRKANAVYGATRGPVTTACPASILREHKNAGLYLDKAAASKIL